MTKNDILKELEIFVDPDVNNWDISQFIIIGKAAKILNNIEDPTIEDIEIWVNPNYYEIIVNSNEMFGEFYTDNDRKVRNLCFAFLYYHKFGYIKFYHGGMYGPKPQSKRIAGFNVEIVKDERLKNFKVIK